MTEQLRSIAPAEHAADRVPQHPLDPLTAAEIEVAAEVVRRERDLGPTCLFPAITLLEPAKDVVLSFKAGDAVEREAFVVVLDRSTGATFEATVGLESAELRTWEEVQGVQPQLLMDEFGEAEALCKADERFREALALRGITDVDLVMVDAEPIGSLAKPEYGGRRLAWGSVWKREHASDNGYARPVEGLNPIIDLNLMEVIEIEEHGVLPIPPESGDFSAKAIGKHRTDLTALEITQPDGPSFVVDGWEVSWQKWRFRAGFNWREGLVLHNVSYDDDGELRPILYRASFNEMLVPYGDPSPSQYRKNFFDIGEVGAGVSANSLELGCDCLGEIHYFDAILADNFGRPVRRPNAICLHEEDSGLLWKHFDVRSGISHSRRSRRLVISFIGTFGNYDYGFYWYFYQDGSIEAEVKLTGVLSAMAVPAGERPAYGRIVAPHVSAANHQHIFCVRLDFDVDGRENRIYEVHTEPEYKGERNPLGNAFRTQVTLLEHESEAQQHVDPLAARHWRIANASVTNRFGDPVAYRLVPGANVMALTHPDASACKRASFTTKHLWVTPYAAQERFAAGEYPNQHLGGAGLPEWTQANRNIVDTDIVVWYTFGVHHAARPEEWPVMSVERIGFMLKPDGFFDRNPALDVPPPKHAHCPH
jgi:primary-amine oxidase